MKCPFYTSVCALFSYYFSHSLVCGKSLKDRRTTCPMCGKRVLRNSLPKHIRVLHPGTDPTKHQARPKPKLRTQPDTTGSVALNTRPAKSITHSSNRRRQYRTETTNVKSPPREENVDMTSLKAKLASSDLKHSSLNMTEPRCFVCEYDSGGSSMFDSERALYEHVSQSHLVSTRSGPRIMCPVCTKPVRGNGKFSTPLMAAKSVFCCLLSHLTGPLGPTDHRWEIPEYVTPHRCPYAECEFKSVRYCLVEPHLLTHSRTRVDVGAHELSCVQGLEGTHESCPRCGKMVLKSNLGKHLKSSVCTMNMKTPLGESDILIDEDCLNGLDISESSDVSLKRPRDEMTKNSGASKRPRRTWKPRKSEEILGTPSLPNHETLNFVEYRCFMCDYEKGSATEFKKEVDLYAHVSKHHVTVTDKVRKIECPLCDSHSPSVKVSRKTESAVRYLFCSMLSHLTSAPRGGKGHHQREIPSYVLAHTCPYPDCGYKSLRYSLIELHVLTHSQKRVPCDNCGLAFKENSIETHRFHCTTSREERQVSCPSCGKMVLKYSLKKHMETSTCARMTTITAALNTSLKGGGDSNHGNSNQGVSDVSATEGDRSLTESVKQELGDKEGDMTEVSAEISSCMSTRPGGLALALPNPDSLNLLEFRCFLCEHAQDRRVEYDMESELYQHVLVSHVNVTRDSRSIQCPLCDTHTPTVRLMKKSEATAVKYLFCSMLSHWTCSPRGGKDHHQRAIPSYVVPHKCTYPDCDYKSLRYCLIELHNLTHSETRVPCPHCGLAFKENSIEVHRLNCVTSLEQRQVACPQCGKLVLRYSLRKHMATSVCSVNASRRKSGTEQGLEDGGQTMETTPASSITDIGGNTDINVDVKTIATRSSPRLRKRKHPVFAAGNVRRSKRKSRATDLGTLSPSLPNTETLNFTEYRCYLCEYLHASADCYPSEAALYEHVSECHVMTDGDKHVIRCPLCVTYCPSVQVAKKTESTVRYLFCSLLSHLTNPPRSGKGHHQREIPSYVLAHTCPYPDCGYKSLRYSLIELHVLTHSQKRVPCDNCGLAFKENSIETHRQNCTTSICERQAQCPRCMKMVVRTGLRKHMDTSTCVSRGPVVVAVHGGVDNLGDILDQGAIDSTEGSMGGIPWGVVEGGLVEGGLVEGDMVEGDMVEAWDNSVNYSEHSHNDVNPNDLNHSDVSHSDVNHSDANYSFFNQGDVNNASIINCIIKTELPDDYPTHQSAYGNNGNLDNSGNLGNHSNLDNHSNQDNSGKLDNYGNLENHGNPDNYGNLGNYGNLDNQSNLGNHSNLDNQSSHDNQDVGSVGESEVGSRDVNTATLSLTEYRCFLCEHSTGEHREFSSEARLYSHVYEIHVARVGGESTLACPQCSFLSGSGWEKVRMSEFRLSRMLMFALLSHLVSGERHQWEVPEYVNPYRCTKPGCQYTTLR